MSTAVLNKSTLDAPSGVQEKSDLTKLLQDLKAKTIELKTQLQPVMQKLADGEIKTSKGVSFLEVKYQIMIQYILQLTFYVHLKLSGKQVENHPVVKSLVELRVILDKMKPIEVKLKYQIDKLVRTAVMGTQKAETGAVTSATAVANDPLAFKPNPMNLLNRNDDDNEEEEDDDTNAKLGVYRPPKLAPVNYDAGKDRKSKEERNEERLKEKASRSRVMKDLMAEMNDAPEEVDVRGGVNEGTGYGDRVDSLIAEKSQYEENNYVRLAVTRKEKKRMQSKNKMRFESEFDNLNDFSNLAGIQDVEEQENERFRNVLNRKSQRAERDVDDIESAMSHGNKRSRQGDEQFHGVLDGKQGGRNKFKRARKVQGRTKKNGQF